MANGRGARCWTARLAGGFFGAALAGLQTTTPAPSMPTRISLKSFPESGSMACVRISLPPNYHSEHGKIEIYGAALQHL
jgi:hypothetical protein